MKQPFALLIVALLCLPNVAGEESKASEWLQAQGSSQAETAASSSPVEPIPGWRKLEGNGVELWLPESYNGGDPSSNDIDLVIATLESLGAEFAILAGVIKQHPDLFKFWAFDSEVGTSGFLTNVNVANEPILSTMAVETYLQMVSRQLPSQYRVIEQSLISLEAHEEAGKLVAEVEVNNIEAKQVLYTIKQGGQMWIVAFTTSTKDFEQRLPEFEQSIETFRVSP